MTVAKGQWIPDQGYIYTCANCGGSGFNANEPCCHCYGLDIPVLMEQFATARGQRYYALLKAILSVQGKAIVDDVLSIKTASGKVLLSDIIGLFIKWQWPRNRWKPFVEWLEETYTVRPGLYERLKDIGFKIGEAIVKVGADGKRQ